LTPRPVDLWSDGAVADVARLPPFDFEGQRSRLTGLAYRILGSWAEAEDVVQDAWLRWARAGSGAGVANPGGWLTTTTSRLALDRLRSAQHRREAYVGPWLAEPDVSPAAPAAEGPEAMAELAESLTLGFLAVLESLHPIERVVFVLADVYDVPFDEIAETVGRSAAACRQVASRARRKVRADRPALDPPAAAQQLVGLLLGAVSAGDVSLVASLLADDVVLVSDGGASRRAARRPVVGPDRVARFLVNVAKRAATGSMEPVLVNGKPGLVLRAADGRLDAVLEAEAVAGRIWRVHVVSAPEKLERL